jgi:hypothetical protein
VTSCRARCTRCKHSWRSRRTSRRCEPRGCVGVWVRVLVCWCHPLMMRALCSVCRCCLLHHATASAPPHTTPQVNACELTVC